MLESMVPGCLGPGLDERDDLQEKAVEIIADVMEGMKAAVVGDMRMMEGFMLDPEAAKLSAQKDVQNAVEGIDETDQILKDTKHDFEVACNSHENAREVFQKAVEALDEAQKQRQNKVNEHRAFEDAFETHFIPLRDGTFQSAAEGERHLRALRPYLHQLQFEASLVAAFWTAGRRVPDERRHFDNFTVGEVEERFDTYKKEMFAEVEQLGPHVTIVERELEAAAAADAARTDDMRAAGLAYGKAFKAAGVAKRDGGLLHRALEEAPRTKEQAMEQYAHAQKQLNAFLQGPYDSFLRLKQRISSLESRPA
eukprot:TRINITY_DN6674_c0_g1_i1.p1 TRINITY_DN6674_c0_g1~~TRINITY_DN6674_c0_g1_i1.p1  ORF type:complete len:310 (+),score=87.92 TRINITY_DN6674_c0_g1_i1:206-1135(+)